MRGILGLGVVVMVDLGEFLQDVGEEGTDIYGFIASRYILHNTVHNGSIFLQITLK